MKTLIPQIFYCSGSTIRAITRKELDKAILKSQARTWNSMSIPKLKVEDLSLNIILKNWNHATLQGV